MDIFISGIPKGLDPFSVSQHIKQSVETVAQVQDIWVHPTKGYGFITLFDATSTSSVLVLNNNISINGGIVKLRRSQTYNVQKSVQSPRPIDAFVQPPYSGGGQTCIQLKYKSLGGYTTYEDYQRDRPCPDTLYNHVQQVPTRRKKRKQPWKDVTRHTAIPTPKSGSTGKVRKRPTKGRKKERSRKNKDPTPREVHTSKRKHCTSTCKEETTTKSLPQNQKDSKNNHQQVTCFEVKNITQATTVPLNLQVVDKPSSEDTKPIANVPLYPLLAEHLGSAESKVHLDPPIVNNPSPGNCNTITNISLKELVADHHALRDINPITNIPKNHGIVDLQDPTDIKPITDILLNYGIFGRQDDQPIGFKSTDLISKNVAIHHTLTENVFHSSVCMDTDRNSILSPLVNVHIYDHAKYLFSVNIDNRSIIKSLSFAIWIKFKIPSKTYIMIYNGRVLNQTFTPIIENGANIHIVVKGMGGMKEGDHPETSQQGKRVMHKGDPSETRQQGREWMTEGNQKETRQQGKGDMTEGDSAETRQQGKGDMTEGDSAETRQQGKGDMTEGDSAETRQQGKGDMTEGDSAEMRQQGKGDMTEGDSAETRQQGKGDMTEGDPAETRQQGKGDMTEGDSAETRQQGKGDMTEGDSAETRQQGKVDMTDGDPAEKMQQRSTTEIASKDIPIGQQHETSDRSSWKEDNEKRYMTEGNQSETALQHERDDDDSDILTEPRTAEAVDQRSESVEKNTNEVSSRCRCSATEVTKHTSMQRVVVEALGIEKYFPNKMTMQEVMCISDDVDKKPMELRNVPWVILRKIIMCDKPGRDKAVNDFYGYSDGSDDEEEQDNDDNYDMCLEKILSKKLKLHPTDIFMSIYVCLHPILQQHICTKMFSCRLAVPFMYKSPTPDNRLMTSLWPFREIVVRGGEIETSLVNCRQNVISFIRLGRPDISKSSIANLLLDGNNNHTFFNRDCKLGDTRKRLSEGLIEASWYIPSRVATEQELSDEEELSDIAMFFNLRGEALKNQQQMEYLGGKSDVLIVVADERLHDNISILDGFKFIQCDIIFLLSGKIQTGTCKDIHRYMQPYLANNCSVHVIGTTEKNGRQLGSQQLRTTILQTTKQCLKNKTNIRNLFQFSKFGSKMKYDVDECSAIFQGAKKKSLEMLKIIDNVPLDQDKTKYLNIKTWNEYAEGKRKLKKDKQTDIIEKENSIIKLRNSLKLRVGQNQWKLLKLFRDICVMKPTNDNELLYFFQYLKLHLDENFRQLRGDLTKGWASNESNIHIEKSETGLSNAAIGIEDLFREIGQLCEIQGQFHEEKQLTRNVAKMVFLGFPFEIMNGDVHDIPLEWVKAIFEDLNVLMQNKKVFALSIIGLQSSGKSTLLNTMFGVSFPVSAGKTTRGIYMQLFPVSKGKFTFDYVLIFDTEGLRSPEEGHYQYQRDNELATLAIGIADLCIINIKGENTSEVHNILQICVHAFFRLKQSNAKLCLNQTCIFTHQNVSTTHVNKALQQQRMKLEETLDMLTEEAAREEKLYRVKYFKDVIGFDRTDNIWYFPDLLLGDPPMAPVNPNYSKKVQRLKSFVFQELAPGMSAQFQTISELYGHLNDLWNGILANDFVFSFKNTLEVKAHKELRKKYSDALMDIESFVNSIDYLARLSIQGYSTERELHDVYCSTRADFKKQLIQVSTAWKKELDKYFENGKYHKIINQWKDHIMTGWGLAIKNANAKMDTILSALLDHKREEFSMKASLDQIKQDLTNEAKALAAKILARRCEGCVEEQLDVNSCFEQMWEKYVRNLNIQSQESTDIGECLCDELKLAFDDNHEVVKLEIKSFWGCHKDEALQIVNTISMFAKNIDKTLATVATHNPLKHFVKAVLPKYHDETILKFTKTLFVYVDTILDQLRQAESKFDNTKIKKLFNHIREEVDKFNNENKENKEKENKENKECISFTDNYIIRVAVFVCDFARPLLQRLEDEYRKKYSLQAQLDKHKIHVYHHFTNLTSKKKTVLVASNYVCDMIRTHICTQVKHELYNDIYVDLLKQCHSKEKLLVQTMADLAKNYVFMCFLTYIEDPRSSVLIWLKSFVNDSCFTEPNRMYYINACRIMEKLFLLIGESVRSNEEQRLDNWLLHFIEKVKPILPLEGLLFDTLADQNVLDISDFKKTLEEGLVKMHKDLKLEFWSVDENTIRWPAKTPAEKILDHHWGCTSVCPFCLEPCILEKDHNEMVNHRCIQHKPNGLAMRFWSDSNKLSKENCNMEVGSDSTYECGPICTRGPPEKHRIGLLRKLFVILGVRKFHAYSDYKVFFPDWNIIPHPDISSSVYWAWVLCQHNANFANYYEKKEADIPESWKNYTKEDAINSLPSLDSL